MNLDAFHAILSKSKTDVWSVIDAAIMVASSDHSEELKIRRDKIVEKLYLSSSSSGGQLCGSCCGNDVVVAEEQHQNNKTPWTPESNHIVKVENDDDDEEEEEVDPFNNLFDYDEQSKILKIRERLQDLNQNDGCLIESLRELADMDITYTALQETDIGRHVNLFRNHPSEEIRTLFKFLVRKWKGVVDEWVQSWQRSEDFLVDGDSPQQNVKAISQENGRYKGSMAYSPNPQNGGSSSEKKYPDPEVKPKPGLPREAPSRAQPSASKSASAPPTSRSKEPVVDNDRLNSARRRLQEKYQEAENAKKQRTIQVMDIHELPKPKNKGAFFPKHKGGFLPGGAITDPSITWRH